MKYFFIKLAKFSYFIFWIAMLIFFLPTKFFRFLWDGHNLKWCDYSFENIKTKRSINTPKQSLVYLLPKKDDEDYVINNNNVVLGILILLLIIVIFIIFFITFA